jgi:2-amino-4-hydroxy-6-hydroxymethyldihydropteridine diphosphokinase/dihydropteroate synthase
LYLLLIWIRLIPNEVLPLPLPRGSFQTHLNNLIKASQSTSTEGFPKEDFAMSPQIPLSSSLPPLAPLLSDRKTHVMSILNLTPDSFSDGGQHSASDMSALENTITTQLDYGATILDIGGQSSRPGAESVTAEEELSRILPAIELICKIDRKRNRGHRSPVVVDGETSSIGNSSASEVDTLSTGHESVLEKPLSAAISIDTYRASVAEAAIRAGAHIINDVSGGTLDPDMLPTVAKLGCTYVLMHMRGTPSTMTGKDCTTYEGDLIQTIGSEILARLRAAEAAGIRRWRIILDPGIGFAKTGKQNLEILRRFDELRNFEGLKGMPWLLGVSRKGFIGNITGVAKAKERHWGTAAAVAAAVQGGADIVRVHDVDEMVKVVKVADAIWRA